MPEQSNVGLVVVLDPEGSGVLVASGVGPLCQGVCRPMPEQSNIDL